LTRGAHSVSATATDAAGNTSVPSATRGFSVDVEDTVAPEAPVLTEPAAVVTTATPAISGTAEAGSLVTVRLDGTVVGTVRAHDSGAWTFTMASPMAQGTHSVTATATDAAGNTSPVSSPRGFVVDSVAPAPPEVLTPTAGATVRPSELRFSGRAEANSTVVVTVDGLVVGTTRAEASSAWSVYSLYQLAQGPHTVSATASDGVGNVSTASAPISFTVMEPPEEEEPPSCGCSSSPTGGAASLLGLLALARRGRRGR
jgi:MYXO-CTERM domain-containing protein